MADPRTVVSLVGVSLLGACVGSFLNVVAYRLPRECMSVVRPRSRCPRCARWIAWYDNLPVFSWLLLRGKCRSCRAPIAWRYPAVELLTALLFMATAGLTMTGPELARPEAHGAAWVAFAFRALALSTLIALALIDADWGILPDVLTLGGAALAPVMVFFAPSLQPTDGGVGRWGAFGATAASVLGPGGTAVLHGIVGGAALAGFLWGVGWIGSRAMKKDAMGFGDVKMTLAMGALLGFWGFLALAFAVFFGAVVGVAMKIFGKGSYIRFGPFLAVGTWAVLVAGEDLLDAWTEFARGLGGR